MERRSPWRWQKVAGPLLGGAIVIAFILIGRHFSGWLPGLEAVLTRLGVWAPFAFLIAYVLLTSLFVPMTLFAVPAGLLFGLLRGFLLVYTGSLLASALMFWLARTLLRPRVRGSIGRHRHLSAVDGAIAAGGLRLMLLLRLTPVHFALYNYLLGARRVRFSAFLFACLGMLPGNFLPVYGGYVAGALARTDESAEMIIWRRGLLIVGLAAALGAVAFVSRLAQRSVRDATPRD